MSYNNNGPGPLVLTTENDPSLWRNEAYLQRLQARRNAARTRKNKPGITNKIRSWFGKRPGTATKRSQRKGKRTRQTRIMYE